MTKSPKKTKPTAPAGLPRLLKEIKARIRQAQTRAILAANAELVRLYWDIGRLIHARQEREGWGAAVIPRIARELRTDLPEEKGFSERNIKRMLAFYRAYPDPDAALPLGEVEPGPPSGTPRSAAPGPPTVKVPQPAAQMVHNEEVPQAVAQTPASAFWMIPWFHHVVLLEKLKDPSIRQWYIQQTVAEGWSRNVLITMIQSEAHLRQGQAITNFDRLLPPPQSDLARQSLKDPYIFDFLTLEKPFRERELEANLLQQLERFLLELGQGFAFVGRQLHLSVGDSDFYVDLLFYQLKLRCFVVIDLKIGGFKPEYAGKMNFYLGVVDDRLRHANDSPSIGLILCQDRNQIIAEYALRGMSKPIGVSEYELTRALPGKFRSALPTVEEIETELSQAAKRPTAPHRDAKPSSRKAKPNPKRANTKTRGDQAPPRKTKQ